MTTVRSPMGPEAVLQRLEAMGIRARLMKGGRCALASMRLGPQPFETAAGRVRIANVVFATVGPDRIKCLRPRALFQLPLVRILDCRDAVSIEARIRLAFQQHVERLRQTHEWLEELGAEVSLIEERSVATFALAGETDSVRVSCIEPRALILPGTGPLSGVALQRAEDRVLAVDRSMDSAVDLEIAVSTRMDELRRMDERMGEQRRRAVMREGPVRPRPSRSGKAHCHRLLLVGPRLAEERACLESLRLRGYRVETARTHAAALKHLEELSPELVMVEMSLGREEGIELIPALREVAGVEEIPVVLVDDHRRAARREAARRAGAAGYLVHPIDVARIAKRLERMVGEPRRRRYTRYDHRLTVRVEAREMPWLATAVGRGGMFITTDEDLPTHSVHQCDLTLPELGRDVQVDAEVLYRVSGAGRTRRGVGVRFREFSDGAEALLIRYLTTLDRGAGNGGQAT